VLFSGEEAEKKLTSLSGGEAARLIFARLAVEQPNVLVLDEPTNHLDLEAIEALVAGLRAFDGTLIFVSHDRWFVSQLATRVFEITADGIDDFRGTYEEYLDNCGDDHLDAEAVLLRVRRERRKGRSSSSAANSRSDPDLRQREQRVKQLKLRRDVITTAIEGAENRIGEIDSLFCDPGFFDKTEPDKVRKLQGEQKDLRVEVEQLMSEWEQLESEIGE
jgi:energy-coupling factor transporter ATP-binding protein EcfA2